MFEPVKNYLKKLSNCLGSIETFGYDSHKGIPFYTGWELKINDYCSNPDVYGIGRDKIYLCQGKNIKNDKGKLWEVIGQGISNRNYCDYLYIFFNKEYLEKIRKNKYYQDFESILNNFNIGLLAINSDLQVEEIIQAKEQNAPKENINLFLRAVSIYESLKELLPCGHGHYYLGCIFFVRKDFIKSLTHFNSSITYLDGFYASIYDEASTDDDPFYRRAVRLRDSLRKNLSS